MGSFPAKQGKFNLYKIMETQDLIDKKVRGFRFENDVHRQFHYIPDMDKYIGAIGVIITVSERHKNCRIKFEDGDAWYYPLELIDQHLLGIENAQVNTNYDPVNSPAHYTDGKIEVIDFIEDKGFGYNLGNCIKYISRAGKKDVNKTVEDLKKAAWYLDRQIKRLEGGKNA